MSDEMVSAVEYIKSVSGMTPEVAKAFGWYIVTGYQTCVSCGKRPVS